MSAIPESMAQLDKMIKNLRARKAYAAFEACAAERFLPVRSGLTY
jgi:hypothetical protein